MFIELVMPSKHLILCHPHLLLPSIFLSIRVFSNELALHIRWPKYWKFSFRISPSGEYSGLISFRMDWLDLFEVQGTLKSLLQHHNSKASALQHSASWWSNSYIKNHLRKGRCLGGRDLQRKGYEEEDWRVEWAVTGSGIHTANPLTWTGYRTGRSQPEAPGFRLRCGRMDFFFFPILLLVIWQKWHLLIPTPSPTKYSFHHLMVYMYSHAEAQKSMCIDS